MSPIDPLVQDVVNEYLSEFITALATYLRPAAGKLGPQWLGLDRNRKSMLVRWSAEGFSAFGIDNWLGKPVQSKYDPDGGLRIARPFRDIRVGQGNQAFLTVAMKQIRPTATASIAIQNDYILELALTSSGALAAVGPVCIAGITEGQVKMISETLDRELPADLERQRATPPWTVALISRGHPEGLLEGFDPDPVLFARSTADTILHATGLQDDPVARYSRAAQTLREAVKSLGTTNERDLHAIVEAMPWILVPEGDFDSFSSRTTLTFEESLADGSVKKATMIPDFLYKQFDHDTLVVEIESGVKRLLTTKQQTGVVLPSAQTVASMFQIMNYSRIISGPMGSLPRRQLGVPDDWGFRYLLIVGSKLQKDFDERSWIALRDHLNSAGVTLRTWDYYIERLERHSKMADFRQK